MFENLNNKLIIDFQGYFAELGSNPWEIVALILDILCVAFLIYELVKIARKSRVWQLLKGIAFIIIATVLSGFLKLRILNFILTAIMTYGVIALIIIFQPELRRGLEQLGSGTFSKIFGIDKNIADKTKEDIYKVAIAMEELAKTRTGALVVFERDIKLQDIVDTGIEVNADVSPQ